MDDVKDFIDNIMNDDLTTAGSSFDNMMLGRLGDAMEQEKVAVAGTVFNGTQEDDVDDIAIEGEWDDEDED